MSKWGIFGLLCINFGITAAFAMGPKPLPVDEGQWERISSWRTIASHWSIAYDKDKKPLALFDLSFPDWNRRVELACLDFNCADYDKAIDLIEQGASDSADDHGQTQDSNLDPYAKQEPDQNPRAKADEAIAALSQLRDENEKQASAPGNRGLQKSPLPIGWWYSIPWKKDNSANLPVGAFGNVGFPLVLSSFTPPAYFNLGDIDFEKISLKYNEFKKAVESFGRGLQFLNEFEFVATGHGGYRIFWNPSKTQQVSRPYRMADLACPKCAVAESLAYDALMKLLGQLISLVPNPIVSGLIATSVGEWIHLNSEVRQIHYDQLIEMLQLSVENTPEAFVISPLSSKELPPFARVESELRDKLIEALYYSKANIGTPWVWLGKDPVQMWKDSENGIKASAWSNAEDLMREGNKLTFINPRFASTEKSVATLSQMASKTENAMVKDKIYALAGDRYWKLFGTQVAVDYSDPDAIATRRQAIEAASVLVHFSVGLIPVPIVGSVVSGAYDNLVHGPMHSAQHWDSRLRGHLQFRQTRGEDWTREMDLLRRQAANPLATSWKEIQETVAARKKAFGIP